MPAFRALVLQIGALLLLSAVAAIAVVCLALIANADISRSLPDVAPVLWIMAALGAAQILSFLLIWRVFLVMRRRFARRLQAATGGLEDRIFVADANGTPRSVLTEHGWTRAAIGEWLDRVHADDRSYWPIRSATDQDASEPQRIELRLKGDDGEWRWHRLRATPLRDRRGTVREWVGTLHDIHEQKLASEHRDLVIGELRHRLKNLVTVIDALAKNSQRPAHAEPGVDGFLQRFLGRLHALGTAGDLVLAGDRIAIDADDLIKATLAPFMGENTQRIRLSGPPLRLAEDFGAGLGLALHELATNALKYGALSVPDGRVSFTWSTDSGQRIAFVWKEQGGPPPTPPAKAGFGTRMIKSLAARESEGHVDIAYPPDGLCCRIEFKKTGAQAHPAE